MEQSKSGYWSKEQNHVMLQKQHPEEMMPLYLESSISGLNIRKCLTHQQLAKLNESSANSSETTLDSHGRAQWLDDNASVVEQGKQAHLMSSLVRSLSASLDSWRTE